MLKDSFNRSNMVYDEYNYDFDYNKTILDYPQNPTSTTKTSETKKEVSQTCNLNGQSFCDINQTFDEIKQKCVTITPETDITPPNSSSGNLYIIDTMNNTQTPI